jgi:hypothetical protein
MKYRRFFKVSNAAIFFGMSLVAVTSAAGSIKTSYLIDGFVEGTGSDLGYGNYDDPTASSGVQCRATFRVTDEREFSITDTKVMGPNGRPAAAVLKDATGAGTARVPVAQSNGRGWEATSSAHNGFGRHDGTWSVILPRVKDAKTCQLGCAGHERAVRVVLSATP